MLHKLLSLVFIFYCCFLSAQQTGVVIEDFITEHDGIDTRSGEIVPINIDEIKRKINFYIDEKFPQIVRYIDNIIWDSYSTFTSNSLRRHSHSFIVRVVIDKEDDIRFIDVNYNPYNKIVTGNYLWTNEGFKIDEDFILLEQKKPDLVDLEIANQEQKPTLTDINAEHSNFMKMIQQKNNGNNGLVPVNVNEINQKIRVYIKANYDTVEYTRNIIWNSYSTFMSPYSMHHYHSFIAQVKVKGYRQVRYIEIFFNPAKNNVISDFKWSEEKENFIRLKNTDK